jgi:methylmalonyl-CoA epimerase
MPIALRHDHVALRVADYDATVRWYADVLGFRVETQWENGGLRVAFLRHGDARLEILGGASPDPQPEDGDLAASLRRAGLHHFCLAVDDLDAAVAELRRRGVPTLAEPVDVAPIGRRIAFVKDNGGNLIQLSGPVNATRAAPPAPRAAG